MTPPDIIAGCKSRLWIGGGGLESRFGAKEPIDLFVADVEAAEFVQGQLIAEAQPRDLGGDTSIQPIQHRTVRRRVDHASSLKKRNGRGSSHGQRRTPRFTPAMLRTRSSGGLESVTTTRSGSSSTAACVDKKFFRT